VDGGGGGKDTLSLNDTSDPVPVQVTVTFSSIGAAAGDDLFGPGGRLYYESLSQIDIDLGASVRYRGDGNNVYVLSTAAGTPLPINTGKNPDTIYIGTLFYDTHIGGGGDGRTGGGPPILNGDVSGIRSAVTIDG